MKRQRAANMKIIPLFLLAILSACSEPIPFDMGPDATSCGLQPEIQATVVVVDKVDFVSTPASDPQFCEELSVHYFRGNQPNDVLTVYQGVHSWDRISVQGWPRLILCDQEPWVFSVESYRVLK